MSFYTFCMVEIEIFIIYHIKLNYQMDSCSKGWCETVSEALEEEAAGKLDFSSAPKRVSCCMKELNGAVTLLASS